MCRIPDYHWLPVATSDKAAAAVSTVRRHSKEGQLDPALSTRRAASKSGAVAQHRQGHAVPEHANDGATHHRAGPVQRERKLLSASGSSGATVPALAGTDAERAAESTAREQRDGSIPAAAQQLNLSAYRRGPEARRRHGIGGTDPTVCSLLCKAGNNAELKKVRLLAVSNTTSCHPAATITPRDVNLEDARSD